MLYMKSKQPNYKIRSLSISVLTILVGLSYSIYVLKDRADGNQILDVLRGTITFFIMVAAFPLIVSLISLATKRTFPHNTFSTLMIIMLIIVTFIMFLGLGPGVAAITFCKVVAFVLFSMSLSSAVNPISSSSSIVTPFFSFSYLLCSLV